MLQRPLEPDPYSVASDMLPDQRALDSANAPITDSSSVTIAVSSPVNLSCCFMSCTRTPGRQGAQVVQVAGEPVHQVHQHGVAVPDERQQRQQLRPEALSVNVRSTDTPSSWRSGFWSTVLTRVYPTR